MAPTSADDGSAGALAPAADGTQDGAGQDASDDALPEGSWQLPLAHLPTEPLTGFRVIELVPGPGGDLWLLGESGAGIDTRLFVDRLGPDGSPVWDAPWINARPSGGLDIGTHPLPSGWLALDADGRATVAGTSIALAAQAQAQTQVWFTQLSPAGIVAWDVMPGAAFITGMGVDDGGRVYAALNMAPNAHNAPLVLTRFGEVATVELSMELHVTVNAPMFLLPGSHDSLLVAGSRPQIFGMATEAFVERYGMRDGAPYWEPPPPARGPREYSGTVAAISDGADGALVVTATDLPTAGPLDLQAGGGARDVQHFSSDGELLWSTRLRNAEGADREQGFADWEGHLAMDADGRLALAYVVGDDLFTRQSGGEALQVFVELLDAQGEFIWEQPRQLPGDGMSSPRGIGFSEDGGLYLVTAPDASVGGLNWLTRLQLD